MSRSCCAASGVSGRASSSLSSSSGFSLPPILRERLFRPFHELFPKLEPDPHRNREPAAPAQARGWLRPNRASERLRSPRWALLFGPRGSRRSTSLSSRIGRDRRKKIPPGRSSAAAANKNLQPQSPVRLARFKTVRFFQSAGSGKEAAANIPNMRSISPKRIDLFPCLTF